MFNFTSKYIKTVVTAIKIYKNLVFIGIGSFLFIYDLQSNKLLLKIRIFDSHKIYGVELSSTADILFIFGGNKTKTYDIIWNSLVLTETKSLVLTETKSFDLLDWILTAKWINNNANVAVITMQNNFYLFDKELNVIKNVLCPQRCIIYSAFIIGNYWDTLTVLSGTVFSEIIVWYPNNSENKAIQRLKGHKGVIFSLHYNDVNGILCSTSDDRTAILWKFTNCVKFLQVNKMCLLKGHTARVFRCKVLTKTIVTCGEDSIVNIWDISGQLIRKIEAHQGDSIWAVDCDETNNFIITGGGDSAVTLHPINTEISELQIVLPSADVPKKIAVMRSNNILTISEKGYLYYYKFDKNVWIHINSHKDLQKYVILEVSQCRNLVSLSGYDGQIYIYKEIDENMQLICNYQTPQCSRIYSFHWLNCNSFITCINEGILSLWILIDGVLELKNLNILPHSSERWTTAACLIDARHFAIGDRKGNLYLYKIGQIHPKQIIKKAHNYLGITDIVSHENEVYSLGRNSTVRKYYLNEDIMFVPACADKLPFTWLTRISCTENIILAFSGSSFVIWDITKRCSILKYNCLGGHRCWDFFNNNLMAKFVYIKDKTVNVLSFNLSALSSKTIIPAYHSWEVNVVKHLNVGDEIIIISGGEDTTLRILQGNSSNLLQTSHTLKSHLSSIRTMCVLLISHDENLEVYYVVTGGGRAQIILWEICIYLKNKQVMNLKCCEKYSYYENISKVESETRIMDIAIEKIEEADKNLLLAACSDGKIKIFCINTINEKVELTLLGNLVYKLKCIMKIKTLLIFGKLILLTAATDGKINFWDITAIKNMYSFDESLKPFDCITIHQSGINSFSCKEIDNNKYILLTGGDDTAIKLTMILFIENSDGLNVKTCTTHELLYYHCAQVTGAFITNDFFFTSSTDQKLLLFKWSIEGNEIKSNLLNNYNTSVADLQGIDCKKIDDKFRIILYGQGVEIVEVD